MPGGRGKKGESSESDKRGGRGGRGGTNTRGARNTQRGRKPVTRASSRSTETLEKETSAETNNDWLIIILLLVFRIFLRTGLILFDFRG